MCKHKLTEPLALGFQVHNQLPRVKELKFILASKFSAAKEPELK